MGDVIMISSDSDSDVEVTCSTDAPQVVSCDATTLTKCIHNVDMNSTLAPSKRHKWLKRKGSLSTSHTMLPEQEVKLDQPVKTDLCDSPDSLKPWEGVSPSTGLQMPGIKAPIGRDCWPVDDLLQQPAIKRTAGEDLTESQLTGGEANSSLFSVKDSSVMTVEDKQYHICASKLFTSPSTSNHVAHDPTDTLFKSSGDAQKKIQSEAVRSAGSSSPAGPWNKCPSSASPLSELEEGDCPTMSYMDDLRNDSPLWIEWEGDDLNLESIFHQDSSDAIEEKTQFVCPVALNQLMTGKTLTPVKDKKPKPSQLLSRQMLSLIKCTIDENYTEGTLQLVSDFFKSGCHPPKNLTIHLLDILLNPKSAPYHCVCSFNQLMKIQRHHMADRDTVPWSWDLLDSVMNNEDPAKMLRSEVVRMFLEYVLQTLADNYMEKRTDSDLCNSIAKATLSCERHFGHVRDVIKWIFAAIVKSPESEDKIEAAKESDEKMRIVSSLQGMLALALDVDQCPALISSKLCQELFNTLITCMPRRAHRMMFLESLQSQPLRCKLLEQLLEYSCPVKVCLPMSLSLLLHFLQNCTPIPDLKGGAEKWRDWEELLQLLWMLLLSYNKTMKGYLSTSASECSNLSSNMIFKKEDRLTKASVCEGVDTFRSRSRHDLDNAPFHVEESLSYLMEYLLAACQE